MHGSSHKRAAHPQSRNGPVSRSETPRELVLELLQLLAGVGMWTAGSVQLLCKSGRHEAVHIWRLSSHRAVLPSDPHCEMPRSAARPAEPRRQLCWNLCLQAPRRITTVRLHHVWLHCTDASRSVPGRRYARARAHQPELVVLILQGAVNDAKGGELSFVLLDSAMSLQCVTSTLDSSKTALECSGAHFQHSTMLYTRHAACESAALHWASTCRQANALLQKILRRDLAWLSGRHVPRPHANSQAAAAWRIKRWLVAQTPGDSVPHGGWGVSTADGRAPQVQKHKRVARCQSGGVLHLSSNQAQADEGYTRSSCE